MNEAVLDFIRATVPASAVEGRTVLEVGSLDVNGSARQVLEPFHPRTYTGVDITPGRGVDRVLSASFLVDEFGPAAFDVVVSTEMLEHVQDWRWAIAQLKRVVAPGGLLVVTTRSPGFHHHGYPHDFWRFTVRDFERVFADLDDLVVRSDPSSPGVFAAGRRRHGGAELPLWDVEVATSPPPPQGPLLDHVRDVVRRRLRR